MYEKHGFWRGGCALNLQTRQVIRIAGQTIEQLKPLSSSYSWNGGLSKWLMSISEFTMQVLAKYATFLLFSSLW